MSDFTREELELLAHLCACQEYNMQDDEDTEEFALLERTHLQVNTLLGRLVREEA